MVSEKPNNTEISLPELLIKGLHKSYIKWPLRIFIYYVMFVTIIYTVHALPFPLALLFIVILDFLRFALWRWIRNRRYKEKTKVINTNK
jgi:Flp pilus assembly protein TadB